MFKQDQGTQNNNNNNNNKIWRDRERELSVGGLKQDQGTQKVKLERKLIVIKDISSVSAFVCVLSVCLSLQKGACTGNLSCFVLSN